MQRGDEANVLLQYVRLGGQVGYIGGIDGLGLPVGEDVGVSPMLSRGAAWLCSEAGSSSCASKLVPWSEPDKSLVAAG